MDWGVSNATLEVRQLRCLQCSSMWPQDDATLLCLRCALLWMHARLSVCVACMAQMRTTGWPNCVPHRVLQEVFIRITREAGVRMSAFA